MALLGRSNVGKSSVLNALAGTRGLARVSSTPGRTQSVNFFRVGDELYLTDLPGYGYARVPEATRQGWERLVVSYLDGRDPLALCVFFVDARTTVLTTVHALQVVKDDIPMTPHDVPVDIVVTPEGVIRTRTAFAKPDRIRWEELSAAQLDAMPVLRRLQLGRTSARRCHG